MQVPKRLRVGQALASASGPGRFIVLNVGSAGEMPSLRGRPLVLARPGPCSGAPRRRPARGGLEPGARYVDEPTGLEVRCTEAGGGALSYAGRPMTIVPRRQLRFPLPWSA
jgi:hypothetical protein